MFANQINLQGEERLYTRRDSWSCTDNAGFQVKNGIYGPLSFIRWPLVPISHYIEVE